jgi:hypothetical protein
MNQPIIIVAPQGAGKTTNAAALKEVFGCERIRDDWDGRSPLLAGDLVLTNCNVCQPPTGARVLTLDAALAQVSAVA